MGSKGLVAVRSWAVRNEPLFQLANLGLVFAFGCILTAYISWTQARLAEAQLLLSRAQVRPNVEVTNSGDPNSSTMQVFYSRDDVKNVSAHAKLFVEQLDHTAKKCRVEIRNFFTKDNTGSTSGRLAGFSASAEADAAANLRFIWAPKEWNEMNERWAALTKDRPGHAQEQLLEIFSTVCNAKARQVCCYVRLEYDNALGERVEDQVVVDYTTLRVRRVEEEPSYHETIDLNRFSGESGVNFSAVTEDLHKIFSGAIRL